MADLAVCWLVACCMHHFLEGLLLLYEVSWLGLFLHFRVLLLGCAMLPPTPTPNPPTQARVRTRTRMHVFTLHTSFLHHHCTQPTCPPTCSPTHSPTPPLAPQQNLRLYREACAVLMEAGDWAGLIVACERFGDPRTGGDPQLWHDALDYFARQEGDCTQQVGAGWGGVGWGARVSA